MKTCTALTVIALSFSLAACGAEDPAKDADDADAVYADDAGGKGDSVRAGRFEIFTGRDGRSYFHLLAGNGEKVLASQGYATARGAEQGVASVRQTGADAAAYQQLTARDGQRYFNLVAGNGQVIATSELYASQAGADRGVATVAGLLARASQQQLGASPARFQVFRGLDDQYYFHLRAGNGEIVLQSQGYTRRASAVTGTAAVRDSGTRADRYHVKDAADGQAYFVLTAGNGEVVGVSETYASRSGAERAAADVAALLRATAVQAAE